MTRDRRCVHRWSPLSLGTEEDFAHLTTFKNFVQSRVRLLGSSPESESEATSRSQLVYLQSRMQWKDEAELSDDEKRSRYERHIDLKWLHELAEEYGFKVDCGSRMVPRPVRLECKGKKTRHRAR